MTDKEIFKMAKENKIIAPNKSTTPEVWPVDEGKDEFIEEQKHVAKSKNKKTADPQDNMEGLISTIVQKLKETSNPSSDESKDEATKRKDKNT